MKSLIKRLLKFMIFRVTRYPRVKYFLLKALSRFPRIKARIYRVVFGGGLPYTYRVMNIPTAQAQLTPRARQIYANLKAVIGRQEKESR